MKTYIYIFTVIALFVTGCSNAGSDQTVSANSKVILDGTNSTTDLDGTITKYTWTQINQSSVAAVHLYDKYSANPSFIAPNVQASTTIKFKLTTTESYHCKTDEDKSCRHHRSSSEVKILVLKSETNSSNSNNSNSDDNANNADNRYHINVSGRIKNDRRRSLSGALVKGNDKESTTRSGGKYVLKNIQSDERLVLNVSHPDYFDNARVLITGENNDFEENIQLFRAHVTQTFNAGEGTTVTDHNASVVFSADTVYRDRNDKKYKGDITVKMRYDNITTSTGKLAFPGAYEGKDKSSKFPLYVHGYMQLSLEDKNGNELTLDSSSGVLVSFPAVKSTNNEANIPLWFYDDSSGYWLKDENAEHINNAYVISTNNIGTYGLHSEAPSAELDVCVNNEIGLAIEGANVVVTSKNWSSNLAQTDVDGALYLDNIIAGEKLTITASKKSKGKVVENKYPTQVILVQDEARELADCIILKGVDVNTTDDNTTKNENNSTAKSDESNTTKSKESNTTKSDEGNTTKSDESNKTVDQIIIDDMKSEESNTTKSEESNTTKSEESNTTKSEESNTTKTEESNTTKSEESNTTKSEESNTTKSEDRNATSDNNSTN